MSDTCTKHNRIECGDHRCPIHYEKEIAEQLANMNEAKKQLKQWCIRHRVSFYSTCALCVQEEIMLTLGNIESAIVPLVRQALRVEIPSPIEEE